MKDDISIPSADLILSSLMSPILVISTKKGTEYKIIFANEACEIFFDRSLKKIIKHDFFDIMNINSDHFINMIKSNPGSIFAQDIEIGSKETKKTVNLRVQPISGHEQLSIISIEEKYHPRGYISSHANMDGALVEVGAPAILSHEIKNPLSSIRGAAQLMGRKADAKNGKLSNLIIGEVDRISTLLNQMQDLGQTQKPNFQAVNIHILLDRALQTIGIANQHLKNIKLYFDPSLPDIWADPDHLMQILINLMQNAADACGAEELPSLIIRTKFVLSGEIKDNHITNKYASVRKLPVEISIEDNGPGIDNEILSEVFNPFVSTKKEGQGLGLAIVRKLVRQMGARIRYERDEIGNMTKFILNFPISLPHEQEEHS
ncbi:hypothetical protein LPB140_07795 [Sphingorhabdus lutea]|uniref:histidine kinase n=1 Tax=Sphingorhabdus lutea TaxID=1913578 RepID=A0A1L3JC57_9SPHN|nr:ATP-binding protein [Sphingorhabdus lutea]APG62710.1 hypothetical protein LPB140_07795 [Sphingorhabdus lutea]